jgi:hypothetical protein
MLKCDTHGEHTDVISYLTVNTQLLNYAELHMGTVAVCTDTNRRVLCSCVLQQVTVHSLTSTPSCVCVCARAVLLNVLLCITK